VSSDFVLVDLIASKLKSAGLSVSISSVVLAKKILATVREKHVFSGYRPSSLAASALYIACIMEGNRIRQMDISSASGVQEPTIRKVYKFLMSRLGIVFPVDESRKLRVKLGALKVRLARVLQIIDNCSKRIKELELEAEHDSNQIELISKVAKDLEAERDSLSLTLETSNSWICPENNLEAREVD
jgi:transcription initiation factor TFIIIB Brf1 subunit/transcription initiation factor TFIIB